MPLIGDWSPTGKLQSKLDSNLTGGAGQMSALPQGSPIGHTPRYFKSIFKRGSVFRHRRPHERFGSSGWAWLGSRPNTADHTVSVLVNRNLRQG